MLRRYTAMGLQSHHLMGPTTLIGSSSLADLIVKGPGVAERHALIEYHPVTRSYWLRDLGTLGGTWCNDQLLYGIIELKSADVLKFGKSAEYVFELPMLQPSPTMKRSASMRHANCAPRTESVADVSLPVIGTKLPSHPHRDQFTRMPVLPKRLCQQPRSPLNLTHHDESDSSRTISTSNTAPRNGDVITPPMKQSTVQRSRRSHSVGRENTFGTSSSTKSSAGTVNLPVLKSSKRISNSSGYSSIEAKTDGSVRHGKSKTAVGNQLLQRIVRLQHEVQRRDEEIIRLRENGLLPSVSGDRVKGTLDEYRVALAEAKAENDKLRMIMALGESNDAAEKELSQEHLSIILYKTFFRVIVDELERLNQSMSDTAARDYSDICSEVVKVVQDPFSFRLMAITARCHRSFQRENLPRQGKVMLGEMYDSFLKETIHPLSNAIDNFLPVIKEAATMGRESARSCIVFSQWSREFGDQIRKNELTKKVMLYKVDELQTRFQENGIPRHWLPPSISPLLHVLIDHCGNEINPTDKANAMQTKELTEPGGDVIPATQLFEEVAKYEAEIKKLKGLVEKSNETIEQLRSEKEDLISQLSAVEKAKYNMEGSALRTRRAARNSQSSTPSETPINPPIPRIEVPRIELEQFGTDESEVFAEPEVRQELQAENNQNNEGEGVEVNVESGDEGGDESSLAEFERQEQRQRVLSEVAEDEREHEDGSGADADDETSTKSKPEIDETPEIVEVHDGQGVGGDENVENEPPESMEIENTDLKTVEAEEGKTSEVEFENNATPRIKSVVDFSMDEDGENQHSDSGENSENEQVDETHIHEENEPDSTPPQTPQSVASNAPTHDADDEVENSEVIFNEQNEANRVQQETHLSEDTGNLPSEPLTPRESEILESQNEAETNNDETTKIETFEQSSETPPDPSEESKTFSPLTSARSLAEATQVPRSEPVEFWHLALTLARMLKVVVPSSAETPDEDHTHRKVALEMIVSEMQSILHAIKNESARS